MTCFTIIHAYIFTNVMLLFLLLFTPIFYNWCTHSTTDTNKVYLLLFLHDITLLHVSLYVNVCVDLTLMLYLYLSQDMNACGSSLTALAMRFAEELKTHFLDVLERLEELWMVARNNDVCSVCLTHVIFICVTYYFSNQFNQ
jgi:hypothetical protein